MLTTVHRTTLVDRSVELLLDAIRDGTFLPGQKLPNEHDLAAQLGVSRTAAREALQRLVSLDVLVARHGHGYFVEQPEAARAIRPEVLTLLRGPEVLFEILEARAALEKELAALAAQRATASHVARLRIALADLEVAIASQKPGTEADLAFHLTIADAAGNRFLNRLTDVIRVYLEGMRGSLPAWNHDRSDVLARHRALYDAIAEHDDAAASAAMHDHMQMVFRQFQARRESMLAAEGMVADPTPSPSPAPQGRGSGTPPPSSE